MADKTTLIVWTERTHAGRGGRSTEHYDRGDVVAILPPGMNPGMVARNDKRFLLVTVDGPPEEYSDFLVHDQVASGDKDPDQHRRRYKIERNSLPPPKRAMLNDNVNSEWVHLTPGEMAASKSMKPPVADPFALL